MSSDGAGSLADHDFDLARQIIEDEIARWVERAYRTCSAGLGAIGEEAAQQRIVDQMRYLHLSDAYLPTAAIATRLELTGLLPKRSSTLGG